MARPLQSPLLVGRDDLLLLADDRIAACAAGRGAALLVTGPAGIGKTRLLRAIGRKARAAGLRWEQADLAPQDAEVPLASILDLARSLDDPSFGLLGADLTAMPRGRGGDALGSRRLLVHDLADRILAAIDRPTLLGFEDAASL